MSGLVCLGACSTITIASESAPRQPFMPKHVLDGCIVGAISSHCEFFLRCSIKDDSQWLEMAGYKQE